jgi:putative inorganic carbon (HCO3(-)) transporter
MTLTARAAGWPRPSVPGEVPLALGLGCFLAIAILLFPLDVAVAIGVFGWFTVLALIDTRVTILALVVARSSIDLSANLDLSAGGAFGGLNLAALLSALLIVVGLLHFAANRVNVSRTPLFKPFVLLLVVYSVGVVYAPDQAAAFQDWLRAFSVFILYLLVFDMLQDENRVQALMKAILLSAVFPTLLALFQIMTGGMEQDPDGFSRVASTFVHPSPFAIYLVTLLPFALMAFLHMGASVSKPALGLLIVGMFVSVLATLTRVSWLGLLVALAIMAAVQYRKALPLVPALVLIVWIFVPGVQDRFSDLTAPTGSLIWRTTAWSQAISIQSSWQLLTGAGLGSVGFHLGNEAHNDYLKVWVEAGLLGFIAFAWLYLGLLKLAIDACRRPTSQLYRALGLAFVAMLAARFVMFGSDNLIGHPVLEWYFWPLAALIASLATRLSPEEEEVEVPSSASLMAPASLMAEGGLS